ncbi:FtsK/SpoIIIE domain-containing protein [Pseudonocardia broussonetiae]|uniref:DUF3631 domain-containing protein n=1 Tax=Pseudonocardia broussonetiae TaxID=2736640 RepID=A0A6M6JT05_9PSEU|nr:FtsK/SpoIIIE domain-containing protein [Pseudonocardia broussonetiae]QJY51234.1 DUF3631 domain-containing protein [Pseudonocardia broussonetiae]
MTDIDMTKSPGPEPVRPRTVLDAVTAGRGSRPALDTSAPIRPEWLRTWDTFAATAGRTGRRAAYRTGRFLLHLPALLALLVVYSPRGLGRVVALLARYLYDYDSAQVRHAHAGNTETAEYVKAQNVRKANLNARWMVAGSVIVVVLVPTLAWTFPAALAVVLAVAAFVWTVKLIPGKEMWELGVAAGVAVAVWWFTPALAARIPAPPVWAILAGAVLAVLALGWIGRPVGKALAPGRKYAVPAELVKPTADMVVDALCRIGLPGMTLNAADRVRDEVRIVAPGVATSAHGYTLEMELPPGVTAEMVVGKRGPLAGALRRDLGCVWPSGNEDRHPGYLRLFLSHKPMNKAVQPPWPLAAGKPVDIFEPLPLFTDEEMRWVSLTLAGTPHLAVGGASGFGKSVWLRQLSCAVAFDLRVRIVVIDGKRSGDLDHVRKLAHAFHEGADPDDVEAVAGELRGLVAEYLKRSKFLSALPAEERSPKVTSALATKYPERLSPIVVFYDEVQEGTQYGVKGNREDKAIRDEITGQLTRLSRVGRSAGIYLVLASQRPEADVIPSSIMGNCSIRVAFKVSDQTHNDQILGTSARKNGIDATMFGTRDKGMAWLKGGDDVDAQVVRSWSEMVDVAVAVELADKAFELRRAAGMLTGQAAGEAPEPVLEVDLLDDVRDVMDHPPVPAMHLGELREALSALRPATWGHLDNDALGGMLRQAGVEPRTVWSRTANKSGKGVKREWLNDGEATVHPISGA